MRMSIFDNDPKAVTDWIRTHYIHGDEHTSWDELDDEFRAFSAGHFGVTRTFHAAYSWAARRGLLPETREGIPVIHQDKKTRQDKKTHQPNGEVATLVEILYSLDSLTSEQKFAAAKELIKD